MASRAAESTTEHGPGSGAEVVLLIRPDVGSAVAWSRRDGSAALACCRSPRTDHLNQFCSLRCDQDSSATPSGTPHCRLWSILIAQRWSVLSERQHLLHPDGCPDGQGRGLRNATKSAYRIATLARSENLARRDVEGHDQITRTVSPAVRSSCDSNDPPPCLSPRAHRSAPGVRETPAGGFTCARLN
jgi:hypothetical protein